MDLWPKNQLKIAPQFIIKFTPSRLKYLEKIIEVQNHCQNETGDIEISNGIQERLESVD